MQEKKRKIILKRSKGLQEKIVGYRRKIHRNPELKYEEHKTAELIAEELEKLGLQVKRNVGEIRQIREELRCMGEELNENMGSTGVLGILTGEKKEGNTVALRADMDALPVAETEDPRHIPNREGFRSEKEGLMHACGHDAHVAMLLGCAALLSEIKDKIRGTIKFIFQPAEEGGNGAKIMRNADVLKDVDAIFGIHVWSDLESGVVQINDGPMLASADKIKIKIEGGGGHGSAPHKTSDPLSASADLINSLYKMADREIDALDPAVISITQLKSGTTWNVIPNKAEMEGTIRTFDTGVRKKIVARTEEIGQSITELRDLTFTFVDHYVSPPTINTKRETAIATESARMLFGQEKVITGKPDMGAEDFAYYLQEIPGCFIFLGTGNKEKGTDHPHHNPKFDVDEDVLYMGTALHSAIALNTLDR